MRLIDACAWVRAGGHTEGAGGRQQPGGQAVACMLRAGGGDAEGVAAECVVLSGRCRSGCRTAWGCNWQSLGSTGQWQQSWIADSFVRTLH